MKKSKKTFGDFYDGLADIPSARERALRVLRYIRKYKPHAKAVLELGVGNGNVIDFMPKKYDLFGIDIDKQYLELTKQKVPDAHLFHQSMHKFRINKSFDVIYSIFNCINYLRSLDTYERTFRAVYRQLEPGGIFVFDVNTPLMLERTKTEKPVFSKERFGFMSDVAKVKGNHIVWDFHIFEHLKKDLYKHHVFPIGIYIFPVEQIKLCLRKYFIVLEQLDYDTLKKPTTKSTNLLFVARKK